MDCVRVFSGDWDDEGVFFYQAYNPKIGDWAIEKQSFSGAPGFNPSRMTWIKPSFAWMLYRCGYGRKPNQERVLKIKLSHATVARLLSGCVLSCHEKNARKPGASSEVCTGRVQWDPARDLWTSDPASRQEPRRCLHERAIQIGIAGRLSELFVQEILSIQNVTSLANQIGLAHSEEKDGAVREAMEKLQAENVFPRERPYIPHCEPEVLRRLAMAPAS